MARNAYISKYKHISGIAFGLIAAIVILFSQSFYFDYVSKIEGKLKTEQASDSEDDSNTTVIKMSQQALSSGVEISIQSVLHFIGQIYDEDDNVTPAVSLNTNGFSAYFQTLFRLIISPNAP